jgi:TolA-binding protein
MKILENILRIETNKLKMFVLAMMFVYSSLLSACSSLPQESFQQSDTSSRDQSGNHETTSSETPHAPQLKQEIDSGEGSEIIRTRVDWNDLEINLKQQIDKETAAQDCKSLESRIISADKASDLYSYLIEATQLADCF